MVQGKETEKKREGDTDKAKARMKRHQLSGQL